MIAEVSRKNVSVLCIHVNTDGIVLEIYFCNNAIFTSLSLLFCLFPPKPECHQGKQDTVLMVIKTTPHSITVGA